MNINLISKTAALVLVLIGTSLPLFAAPVTFWFSGEVEDFSNISNTAPTGVSVGTPFVGRISYDPANIHSSETNNSGGGTRSYFTFATTNAYSFTLYIAGHTIRNKDQFGISGQVELDNDVSGIDFYLSETSSDGLLIDGTEMVPFPNQASLSFSMTDENGTALTSAALPASAPVLSAFSEGGFMVISVRNPNGTIDLSRVNGVVSMISTNEIVQLSIRRPSASTVQLAWPLYASGYTLQSNTNLAPGNWQTVATAVVDTATEHTVTVPSAGAPKFFRLKK